MISVTLSDETVVMLHRALFVVDVIQTSVGDVPYEWTPEFDEAGVIAAIEASVAGSPLEVEGNGIGWVLPVGARQVEVTDADYDADLLNFRWLDGAYRGDCSIPFEFSKETTAADVQSAIASLIEA